MKKIFLTIVFFLGLCLSSFAQNLQEVVYLKNGSIIRGTIIEQVPNESLKIQTSDGSIFAYKMSEVIKITKDFKQQKSSINNGGLDFSDDHALHFGYKGFIDFGYTFGTGTFGLDRIEFLTTHGVQFNPYIFAGLGSGINYYIDGEGIVVPVFADIRGTFLNGNITPFIDLKAGYSFVDAEGFFLNPSLGCRFGLGKRMGLNIGVGYSLQKADFGYSDGYDYYSGIVSIGGVSLKLGIDF